MIELKLLVRISGMTCSACSGSILASLEKLPGVIDSNISLITEEGLIRFDKSLTDSEKIVETIEDTGFDVQIIKELLEDLDVSVDALYSTTLSISGMTCGACSASITKALEKVQGVRSVSINVMTEDGKVIHDSSVTPEEIVTAIEDCGFDASVSSSDALSSKVHETILAVTGMTCGACSASITNALEQMEGVMDVNVSLLTEEAKVKHSALVDAEHLKTAIEDCGFDALILRTAAVSQEVNNYETFALRIYGLGESLNMLEFQYNIEALLKSFGPAVQSYNIIIDPRLQHALDNPDNQVRSSLISPSSDDLDEFDGNDQLINELTIVYDSSLLGPRELFDKLNDLDNDVSFLILNSVDQSSNMQLQLLSKTKEINYWKSNFIYAACVAVPVFILSKTQNTSFWKTKMIFDGLFWTSFIQGVLASYVQFKLGIAFLKKFVQFVRNRGSSATMDILVCVSTMISFLFSVLCIFISVWNGNTEAPPIVLFDTSSMIITYISIGKCLENRAKGATSTALSKLISLTPSSCVIVTDLQKYQKYINTIEKEAGSEGNDDSFPTKSIQIDLIQKNDVTIVTPGAKVPADGEIIFGDSEIDESLLTGESLPVYKKPGDQVIGGSINGAGLLHVKVTKIGKDSQLQKVIKLVKESQINKAPIQRYSDYIAARFVPAVLFVALLTFVFWFFLCYIGNTSLPKVFEKEENGKFFVCLKLAISVIVVACPCALGLASPTAIMVGTGIGAKNGVLIKGGDILEKASDLNIILFDKTGTLTTGKMSLLSYKIYKDMASDVWWNLIGGLELGSEHPIAQALVKIAKKELSMFEEDSFNAKLKSFETLTGLGVKGEMVLGTNKYDISIGNKRLAELSKIEIEKIQSSNTVLYVCIDGELSGVIELTDELKPGSKPVLDYLKYEKGFILGMVTGDNTKVAEKVGKQLGIPPCNIFSEVSPVNKDKVVNELRDKFGGYSNVKIAFVGDGINDAPALSQADIGIAISNGTDIAIESADIVIMNESNDIQGIPIALDISEKTFKKIKMNFVWATIYNLIMVPFAMGCFLPFNIMLPPMMAGLAMAFSSISVVISSLMLNWWKLDMKIGRDYKRDHENFLEFDLKSFDVNDFNRFKR